METNLPISYSNIILFIVLVVFLGHPEHVVLIHACLALSGSIVASHNFTNKMIGDLYVHWVPLLLSLSMVDFSKIGMRQFVFAAAYPIIYLSVKSYKDENKNTKFQMVNPIKHIQGMYPDISMYIFMLYYVTLGGIIGAYFSLGSRSP